MIAPPSIDALKAILKLQQADPSAWDDLSKWLAAAQQDLVSTMASTEGPQLHRAQGAYSALNDFLETLRTAKERLAQWRQGDGV